MTWMSICYWTPLATIRALMEWVVEPTNEFPTASVIHSHNVIMGRLRATKLRLISISKYQITKGVPTYWRKIYYRRHGVALGIAILFHLLSGCPDWSLRCHRRLKNLSRWGKTGTEIYGLFRSEPFIRILILSATAVCSSSIIGFEKSLERHSRRNLGCLIVSCVVL